MTPEGKVKDWLMTRVARRYGHLPYWKYAPPGGRFGQAGIGDRILVIDRIPVMIEVKSGEGGYDLTALQKKRLREFDAAGGVAASLVGKDEAKLNAIFDEIDRRRAIWHRADQLIQQETSDAAAQSGS